MRTRFMLIQTGPCTMRRRSLRWRVRTGIALPLILVCLVVVMLLAAAVTQAVVIYARQASMLQHQQQAQWLADSGLQRALHRVRADRQYGGEQWRLPASILGGTEDAVVAIQVAPAEQGTDKWNIRIEASYPELPPQRVVVSREVVIDDISLGQPGPGENNEP